VIFSRHLPYQLLEVFRQSGSSYWFGLSAINALRDLVANRNSSTKSNITRAIVRAQCQNAFSQIDKGDMIASASHYGSPYGIYHFAKGWGFLRRTGDNVANGAIDEVKIYDRALSAAEVRRLGFAQGAYLPH